MLVGLLALLGWGLLFQSVQSLVQLFIWALVLAYLLLVPMQTIEWVLVWLSKRLFRRPVPAKFARWLAVSAAYVVFTVLALQFVNKGLPVIVDQGKALMQQVQNSVVEASRPSARLSHNPLVVLETRVAVLASEWIGTERLKAWLHLPTADTEQVRSALVAQALQGLKQPDTFAAHDNLDKAWDGALAFLKNMLQSGLYGLSLFLLVFYFLVDGPIIGAWLTQHFPGPYTRLLVEGAHRILLAFIKGQVLLGLLTGFYMFVVYSLFGMPYALLLASVFALAEVLPVVGTWIGITPGLIVAGLTLGPWTMGWIWLCSYLYQTIKDNIIAPKVVGDVIGLHPVVVILSLLLFGKALGLFGILLALPIAALVCLVLQAVASGSVTHWCPTGRCVPMFTAFGLTWLLLDVLVHHQRDVLLIVASTALLATILAPMVNRGQRPLKSRLLSIALVYVGLAAFSGTVVRTVWPALVEQFQLLLAQAPQALLVFKQVTQWMLQALPFLKNQLLWLDLLPQWLPKLFPMLLSRLFLVSSNTLSLMISGLTTLVLLFYVLSDGHRYVSSLVSYCPPAFQASLARFCAFWQDTYGQWVRRRLLVGVASALLLALTLALLQVPYAGVLGLGFGWLSTVPVVGLWLGMVPVFMVMFLSHWTITQGGILLLQCLWCLLMVLCGLWIRRWLRRGGGQLFVQPVSVGIHPLVWLLGFLLCVEWFGAWAWLAVFPVVTGVTALFLTLEAPEKTSP